MAPKDKPYSNETRPVSLGGQYKKRKGSEFFSASVTARGKKGSELKVGYDTVQTKRKRPFVSERHREKRFHSAHIVDRNCLTKFLPFFIITARYSQDTRFRLCNDTP